MKGYPIVLKNSLQGVRSLFDLQKKLLFSDSIDGVNIQKEKLNWSWTENNGFSGQNQVFKATVDQDGGDTTLEFKDHLERIWKIKWNLRFDHSLKIQRSDSTQEFRFFDKCSVSWKFGVALDFPDFIEKQVEKLNQAETAADSKLLLEVKYESKAISIEHRICTVFVSQPLIATVEEFSLISAKLSSKISDLNKCVENYKRDHFFGFPHNSWSLVIYFKNHPESKTYFDENGADISKKFEQATSSLMGKTEVSLQVPLLYLIFHELSPSDSALICQCLKKFHQNYFKKYNAKIWDSKKRIEPFDLA